MTDNAIPTNYAVGVASRLIDVQVAALIHAGMPTHLVLEMLVDLTSNVLAGITDASQRMTTRGFVLKQIRERTEKKIAAMRPIPPPTAK